MLTEPKRGLPFTQFTRAFGFAFRRQAQGSRRLFTALMLLSLMFSGCRNTQTDHPRNIVAIDPDGGLRVLANQKTNAPGSSAPVSRLVKGTVPRSSRQVTQITRYRRQAREYLDFIFLNNPVLDGHTNILLFIQGGLNDIEDGVQRANRLTEEIQTNSINPAYPIFVAWDASLFSAWGEQYSTHRGHNARRTAALLAPFTFLANAGRLATRLPLSAFEQGYAGLRTTRATAFGSDTNAPSFLPRPELVNTQYLALKSRGFDVQFSDSGDTSALAARGALMVVQAAPKIISEGVVDTGGKVAWDYMLRRTKTMFTLPNSFEPGGMDFFAEALAAYLRTNSNKQVTIIAHSMGTIVANELIRSYGDRLRISNIVYMAAACGVDEAARVLIPFLLTHPGAHFYNLSQHPANDFSELPYPLLEPIIPRGSLLDWIDAYYSSTETDYGWTLGKWDNAILGTKRFLSANHLERREGSRLKHQFHMKCFGYGPDAQYGPQHHGGFDEWRFWLPAFWQAGPYDPAWRHDLLND